MAKSKKAEWLDNLMERLSEYVGVAVNHDEVTKQNVVASIQNEIWHYNNMFAKAVPTHIEEGEDNGKD